MIGAGLSVCGVCVADEREKLSVASRELLIVRSDQYGGRERSQRLLQRCLCGGRSRRRVGTRSRN